jgi:leader peptidase (prepilin peptidase) / N-methyltransferase
MNVALAILVTAVAVGSLACIAGERIRAYRLPPFAFDVRAVIIGVSVVAARGFLAWRGAGGFDTSLLFAVAAVATITDLQYGYVFDRVLVAGGAALGVAEAMHGDAVGAVAGAAGAAFTVALPWALSRARGMGLGDVKLAAVLGCGLSCYGAMRAIWCAFVLGAVVSVGCVVTRRRSWGDALPFAPFLALGTVLATFGAAW